MVYDHINHYGGHIKEICLLEGMKGCYAERTLGREGEYWQDSMVIA